MKIELHLHTAESSTCGKVGAEEAMQAYKQHQYDAVVITDHFNRVSLKRLGYSDEKEKVDRFLHGYRTAKKAGEALGLKVFLGVEMAFHASNSNDYLVYGLDEDFFYANPNMDELHLSEFLAMKPENALIYQAHPFRNGMTVTDPKRIFGIEVFNGHKGHNSRNSIALAWARLHQMHVISGSDAHHPHILCTGGIITDRDVASMPELVEVLREDAYALITKNPLDETYWCRDSVPGP